MGKHLGQKPVDQERRFAGPRRVQRLNGPLRTVLDDLGVDFTEHATVGHPDGQHTGEGAETDDAHEHQGPDHVGDGPTEIQQHAGRQIEATAAQTAPAGTVPIHLVDDAGETQTIRSQKRQRKPHHDGQRRAHDRNLDGFDRRHDEES